jgi:hypothetical protein
MQNTIRMLLIVFSFHPLLADQPSRETTQISTQGLSYEEINEAMAKNQKRFASCHEKWSKGKANAEQTVRIYFLVGADGIVKSARPTKEDRSDRELSECVLKSIKKVTFPKSPLGTETEVKAYPFYFRKADR